MRNIKVTLEYEGTHYLGWQRQPQGMTIQQALEEALGKILGVATRVTGASRTDAGVHARGQSANFRVESDLTPERLRGALNALLPRDIVVVESREVPPDFDSRFSALSKLYHYTIWNRSVRPAMFRQFMWHYRWGLDLDLMRAATPALLGKHDFKAFESANAQSETTVRTITRAEWMGNGSQLIFAIEADAFLYNMVRAIVGTLTEVGRGKIAPEEMPAVIASADRSHAGRTAPPQGLCLMEVRYDLPELPDLPVAGD